MENSFEENLELLLAETKSDALVKLRMKNQEYAKKASRRANILEILEECLLQNQAAWGEEQKELVKELLELEADASATEQNAIYLQGCVDAFRLLHKMGWIL